MQNVINWLTKNWPLIVTITAMVPSLLVALTKAPTGGGAGAWFKWVMQIFSVLTHKDEPGTLKLPLMTSKMNRKIMGPPSPPTPQAPPTPPLVSLLLIALFATQTSCGWLQTKGKEVGKDIVDCAIEAGRGQVIALLKPIYDLLEGDKAGWGAALAALETAGIDALPCAIMAVVADLLKPGAPGASPQVASARAEKAQFLLAWLKKSQDKKVYTFGVKGVTR